MLSDQVPLKASNVGRFYYRRFKRLVPVYLVITLATWFATQIFVFPLDNERLVVDTKWALAYVSNIRAAAEPTGYFVLVRVELFTHPCKIGYSGWSIS